MNRKVIILPQKTSFPPSVSLNNLTKVLPSNHGYDIDVVKQYYDERIGIMKKIAYGGFYTALVMYSVTIYDIIKCWDSLNLGHLGILMGPLYTFPGMFIGFYFGTTMGRLNGQMSTEIRNNNQNNTAALSDRVKELEQEQRALRDIIEKLSNT